ncbi:DUF559 domain-containing protein [Leucobacter triazinivorans]|uniref:DUF559 domain-containing protein n=2 Tax=Leucobacter triazinivorans TaxID=1784719 RepID=A0A4P6KIK1_9MICO|nr:DUF559 domain-containing protein [Leucobacter triazinivorans]
MRSAELIARGYTAHALKQACAAGAVSRPARGWIGLPSLDSELRYAVQHGVILTCVSLARRHRLWVRRDSGCHFAVRSRHAHVRVEQHKLHWGRAVRRREPWAVLDSIENALNYVATCESPEDALATWESALKAGLVTREALARYPLSGVARELLEQCTPFSGSGLESYVKRRVASLGLTIVAQAWVLGHRVDFLIEGWLVFEIDGSTHTGEQRDRDNRYDTLLEVNGYGRIRAGYRPVMFEWPRVQAGIMDLISQGQPRPWCRTSPQKRT